MIGLEFLLILSSVIRIGESQTFSGKVLITTGLGDDITQVTEIFDVKDPSNLCQTLPNYPLPVHGASGGLIQDKYPFICGGTECNFSECISTDCYYFNIDSGSWEYSTSTVISGWIECYTFFTTMLWSKLQNCKFHF